MLDIKRGREEIVYKKKKRKKKKQVKVYILVARRLAGSSLEACQAFEQSSRPPNNIPKKTGPVF